MTDKAAVNRSETTGELGQGWNWICNQLYPPVETAVVYGGGVYPGYSRLGEPTRKAVAPEPIEDIAAIAEMRTDVWRLEHLVRDAMRQVEFLAKSTREIPEAFELPPRARKRVRARVRRRYEPARFRFIESADEVDFKDAEERDGNLPT